MRRDEQRLSDILEFLDWIVKAISGRTEGGFEADETLCYAVARLSPELSASGGKNRI